MQLSLVGLLTIGQNLIGPLGWSIHITNRGVEVWPGGLPETFCTDHWRCRFVQQGGQDLIGNDVVEILSKLDRAGLDVTKTENLYTFDGERGFSLGQGE